MSLCDLFVTCCFTAFISSNLGAMIPASDGRTKNQAKPNMFMPRQLPKYQNATSTNMTSHLSTLPSGEIVLVADYSRQAIYISSLHDINFSKLPISSPGSPWAVDYDPVSQMVFWTDYSSRAIKCAHLDGSDYSVITSGGISYPKGIAVDPYAKEIYWTDTGNDDIEMINYDGSGRRQVLYLSSRDPHAIVIHFTRRELYWTNSYSSYASIEKANCDGSNRQTLVSSTIYRPYGIALNDQQSRLYWSDNNYDRIESIDLWGTDRRLILSVSSSPYGIYWYNGDIYWADSSYDAIGVVNENSKSYHWLGSGYFSNPYDIYVGFSHYQEYFNWKCDFDISMCSWQQSDQDEFDWSRHSGPTTLNTTGPSHDHTQQDQSGYYMYTNAANRETGDTATLISPLINASGSDPHCFRFWYHMFGVSSGSLMVYFQPELETESPRLIWSQYGNKQDEWLGAEVKLMVSGIGNIVVEGVVGSPTSNDIAIDDVQCGRCGEATNLVCDETSMTVFLDIVRLGLSSNNDVTFWNSSCHGYDYDSETIAIFTSFDDCGTTLTEDNDVIIFSNKIVATTSSEIRSTDVEIKVNCSLNRDYHVQMSYLPHEWIKYVSEDGYGNFSIKIYQYPDEQFETPFPTSSYPQQIDVGDSIYMATTMSFIKDTETMNERCWATQSANPLDAVRQDLIEKGCPATSNVTVYASDDPTLQPFSFKAFAFDKNMEVIYIHCDVLVCQQSGPGSNCSHACKSSRAKRESDFPRDMSSGPHTVSQGPFISQPAPVGNAQGKALDTNGILLILVCVCMIVLAISVVYSRRRRQK